MSDAIAVKGLAATAPAFAPLFRVMLIQALARERAILLSWIGITTAAFLIAPAGLPRLLALIGLFYAAALGARYGGEPAATGTIEFLWTRPLSRRSWLGTQFVIGLVPLAMFELFVTLLLHPSVEAIAFSWLAPELVLAPEPAVDSWARSMFVPFHAAVYADVFGWASDSSRARNASELRALGWLVGSFRIAAVVGFVALGWMYLNRFEIENGRAQYDLLALWSACAALTYLLLLYAGVLRRLPRREFGGSS
jgi:hypothetical protein